MRLILDPFFKNTYKAGKIEKNPEKSAQFFRASFYILLSMLINSVFEKKNLEVRFPIYFKKEENFELWKFN